MVRAKVAHTRCVAHTADAISIDGCHPKTAEPRVPDAISAIHNLTMLPYPLGYLEDDRMALATYQLMQSGRLSAGAIQAWLDSFQLLAGHDDETETLGGTNAEHVLQSLFFRVRRKIESMNGSTRSKRRWTASTSFCSNPPPDIVSRLSMAYGRFRETSMNRIRYVLP